MSSSNTNSVAENDFIGSSDMNQGWNDEPINVSGAQQSSENSKELLVDNHFYNNFGDIFYEDALKDVMQETIAAARENKEKEESQKTVRA
jgi:hypothetical protein